MKTTPKLKIASSLVRPILVLSFLFLAALPCSASDCHRRSLAQNVSQSLPLPNSATTASNLARTRSGPEGANTPRDATMDECNLGGRTIRVAVSSQPPLVDCQQDFGGDWNCNGSNIEAIKVLQQKLNFRVEWLVLSAASHHPVAASSNSSGRMSPVKENVTTSGVMLALVESGRAWLSANGYMSIISNRDSEKLKMSQPFDAFKMHFLLSKSVRDHDHIFVKPFNSQAWLAILSSALLVVPALYLVNKTSCHYYYRKDLVPYLGHISLWQCLRFKLIRCLRCFSLITTNNDRKASESFIFPSERELIEQVVASANPLQGIEPFSSSSGRPGTYNEERRKKLLRRQMAGQRRRALKLGRRSRQSGFFRVAYVAWYVIGSLAAQGGETEDLPEADSTRILVAFWWLYLIVIVSIHSGILTAILTFPKQNDFIQTLDDFMALGRHERGNGMQLAVDKFSEISHLLSDPASSHKSPLQDLLTPGGTQSGHAPLVPIVEVDLSRHRERVLDEVQRGRAAYLEEKSAINLIITQEYFDQRPAKCQFKSSRFPVDIIPMSLALSRGRFSRQCLREIDSILSRIMQTGLAQKWRRRFEAQGNDCLETVVINAGDVDKIELRHVELAFWLLAAGLALGLVILALEVIWLFTSAELDPEESLGSSSSSSSSSSDSSSSSASGESSDSEEEEEEDELRLGHRVVLAEKGLRSLKLSDGRAKLSKLTKELRLEEDQAPPPPPPQSKVELREERRRKRLARAAERRAARLKRTIGLVKRLQEGKLYTDLLPAKKSASTVVDKIQARARRASHAIVSHFSAPTGSSHRPPATVRRRRRNRQLRNNRVSPTTTEATNSTAGRPLDSPA